MRGVHRHKTQKEKLSTVTLAKKKGKKKGKAETQPRKGRWNAQSGSKRCGEKNPIHQNANTGD